MCLKSNVIPLSFICEIYKSRNSFQVTTTSLSPINGGFSCYFNTECCKQIYKRHYLENENEQPIIYSNITLMKLDWIKNYLNHVNSFTPVNNKQNITNSIQQITVNRIIWFLKIAEHSAK